MKPPFRKTFSNYKFAPVEILANKVSIKCEITIYQDPFLKVSSGLKTKGNEAVALIRLLTAAPLYCNDSKWIQTKNVQLQLHVCCH